ncbi:DUF1799 domain-containing protein [Methylibium sp.]|uniref:DUF1799 domain-containing protein n=1 Tax=Methylibium sp. TaxID=2067992 RepID=UPI003D11A71A
MFGAPDDVKERVRAWMHGSAHDGDVEVWPELWHAVNVFLAMAAQWRVLVIGHRLYYQGLDLSAIGAPLREHRRIAHAVPFEELMPTLRLLERAARDVLNKD